MPRIIAILSILLLSPVAAVGQPAAEAPPAGTANAPATEESEPAEAKPAESKSAESRPAESKSAESKPVDNKPVDEMAKLRREVERLHRELVNQRSQLNGQVAGLRKAMEARLAGVTNGIEAVRISVDAVKNAVASIQLPPRPAITIMADSSAPILCGPQGCEATALDHCQKVGYEAVHVVHKLEAPAKWLLTFVCKDR